MKWDYGMTNRHISRSDHASHIDTPLSFALMETKPLVFYQLTGLCVGEFEEVVNELIPLAEAQRFADRDRPNRIRAIGGGAKSELSLNDQILLTVMWLNNYPTHETLGFLFGVSDSTVSRVVKRVRPLLHRLGRDDLIKPEPSRKGRPKLAELTAKVPDLAELIPIP